MDSFSLRQEQSELLKSVADLKHKLDVGEARMKEMHVEEMRYLEEIPVYKKQAQEAKLQAQEAQEKVIPLRKDLDSANAELIKARGLTIREEIALKELKETQSKIIDETKTINEQVKQRHEKLKERESMVENREKLCDSRDIEHKNKESKLDNREFELLKNEETHKNNEKKLIEDISVHDLNVTLHRNKVNTFIESKELHLIDEQNLSIKSQRVERLIKENTELKSQLLLQADKMSQATKLAENKQVSLDKALADLINQENSLKIKELKIKKMAHDAGLQKELKDLEASLK